MTFVAWPFLFAALAGAIPVVLHMINRQQAKNLPFSTLRFLRISAEKTRRRKRIHDLLLMLVRLAVLMLIAFGLAEPTMTSLSEFWGSGTSAVALIVDNSASMGVIDDGRPRLETARGAAREIMDELQDGDQVVLMLTGGPQFEGQGQLQRTHDKVLQTLDRVEVSYQRAELASKVDEARRLLAETDTENQQIFVLTDMQELSWEGLMEEVAGPVGAAPADGEQPADKERSIPVVFVDCHRAPKPNVAVTEVELKATVPVAGLPINAAVEVLNASPVIQTRHLELYVDNEKRATSPQLEIPPESRLKHDFQFSFERGGMHRGEVRLVGEDGSRYDDHRYFSMEVDQGIPVAIVKPARHEIAYLEDTFYLEQALAPGKMGEWAIRTTTLTAGELLSEPLSNYKVIFCVNLAAPGSDTADRLRSYVAGGGNLFWIGGDNVMPGEYNGMNDVAGGQLLPAPLVDVRLPLPGEDRDSWHIASLDSEHGAMAYFLDPASLYQSVLVYKHLRMDTAAVPGVEVLARLDDGEALLAHGRVDQGTVTFLGTSAHVGWSNFPVRPLFLPMLAQLTFDLAGAEQARHQGLAGQPIVLPLEEELRPVSVEVRPPSGAMIRQKSEAVEARPGQEFTFADTYQVGIYSLQMLDTARPTTIAYSVNLDADEADSKTLAHDEIAKRFGQTPVIFAEDPEDLSSTFRELREGESLWELVLAIVLLVLVFETFISNLLNPTQDDDQYKHLAPGMRRLAKKGRSAA